MYRAWYAARLKSGLIRAQLPATTWEAQPLSRFLSDASLADPQAYAAHRQTLAPRFFFDSQQIQHFRSSVPQWDTDEISPLTQASEVHQGRFRFFSHERVEVGLPPRWNVDPVTNHAFPDDRHWSQIGDFEAGDIKLVWETNRFGFVFPLVRSYWRRGNEQDAELFWQLVESWHAANPPETGPNWKCGQEISLRVMAWCFGLYGFAASPASTPQRVAMLAQAIAVSGVRIESNIGYALSQQNNHGLSEAMGLWTIGNLFPEFSDSSRWAARGRALLEKQGRELIYADGTFSQHSMNYHRVMLHDYLWSIRLGDVLGQPFTEGLRDRIAKAGDFIYQMQDPSTGQVPCYGQDDGALILPLSNCDYRDYRPVVQATHFLTTGTRRLEAGPWDEDLFWLFGVVDHDVPPVAMPNWSRESEDQRNESRRDFEAPVGGYVTLRSPHGFAVTRAAKFRHRPAQADMLHVDLWWHGLNIAIDPGTYSYNAPPPWNNPFAHTAYHNTVTVDDKDQMERASRFMWLPWLKGTSYGKNVPIRGDASCWNGEHDGYRRLDDPVVHRRGVVRLGADHWLIVDALCGRQPHHCRLHWLLLDAPCEIDSDHNIVEIETPAGGYRIATTSSVSGSRFEVKRADVASARGWRSSYYHSREPALSLSLEATAPRVVFATLFGPDAQSPDVRGNDVRVEAAGWDAIVTLNPMDHDGLPLIQSVTANGSLATSSHYSDRQPSLLPAESLPCTYC